MSYVSLVEQSTTPPTPTTGKVRVYVGTDGNLRSVDDAGAVIIYGAGVTQEQVEDFVGALIQAGSSKVSINYNDAGNILSIDVNQANINHDALLNFVANKHIDHSTVNVNAGAGMSGGGAITASVTLTNADRGSVAVTTHEAALDPHPQYLTSAEGSAAYQPLDGDLTAVASLAGTGIVTRTAANTMTTRTITQSTGITVSNGDGVSGNPTIAITSTGVSAGLYGNNAQVPQFNVNAQGQLTSATSVNISINAAQVQDFTEASQDVIGSTLVDSSSIDFQYNDVANTQTAVVLPAGVNHDALQNFVANEHIDHSAVSISAGTGLTGGGDITTNRTISMPNVGTAGTYGNASNYPVITTDAQGRVTNVTTQAVAGGGWTELVTTADIIVNSNVTLTNVTQLQFAATSGMTYYLEYTIIFRAQATTTGFAITIGTSNTAAGTLACMANIPIAADGTAALYTGNITALGDVVTGTGVQTAQPTWFICNVKGVFICTTSGTVLPQFRSEVNGSNVNFGTGSVALIRKF